MELVGGLPWKLSEDDPEVDGEDLEVTRLETREVDIERAKVDEAVPHRFIITRGDLDTHGFSQGCPGCKAILRGTARQGHAEACRRRLAKEMKDDGKVLRSHAKQEAFFEKVMEADVENRKRARPSEAASSSTPGGAASSSSCAAADPGAAVRPSVPEDMELSPYPGAAAASSTTLGKRSAEDMDLGPPAPERPRKLTTAQQEWYDTLERDEEEAKKMRDDEDGGKRQLEHWEEAVKRFKDEKGDDKVLEDMEIGILDINQEEDFYFGGWAMDDLSGKELDRKAVDGARREELQFMMDLGVWEPATLDECMKQTGKPPVTTKWVDVDKGRDGSIVVRSRLVARDFKTKTGREQFDVFAAMPPLESKRMLFRMLMVDGSVKGREDQGHVKLMFVDVKKAHLNGKLKDDEYAYIQLPEEAGSGVARLKRWLYGMRPAANAWESDYAKHLEENGFRRGVAAPTTFAHIEKGIRLVVWGDDFTFLGRDGDLKWAAGLMESWYEIKVRGIFGPDFHDDKEIRILNRKLTWRGDHVTYEADDKHVSTIVKELGLNEDSKGLDVPIDKESDDGDEGEPLAGNQAKAYRRLAATVNYLALDRPDVQFSASVLSRTMACPTTKGWAMLKRVGRYLLSHPTLIFEYHRVGIEDAGLLVGHSDSDWAGCRGARRSMSGGTISVAGGLLKGWSNRQGSVALSSGEAEYYAVVKTVGEMLGLKAVAKDLNWEFKIIVYVDSVAAKGIASRVGIGKVRHLEVRFLWLQEVVQHRDVQIRKVLGTQNPADVMTKPTSFAEAVRLLKPVGVRDEKRPRERWADIAEDDDEFQF